MLAEFETQVKTAGQVEQKYQIVSVDSIANAEIDDKPIIKNLIDEKESLIISAAAGVGKSLLTNCIALVLGNPTAGKLWNLFPIPNEVKTLIVQSENGFNAFHKRLNKLFNAYPDMRNGAKNVFTVQTKNDCRIVGNLTDNKFQQFLIDSLLSVSAKVLILDPLISYHGEDENANAAMRHSLDCLSMVCDRASAAVILCHHYNRQNLTRGAASIRDWADNMLLMDFEKKTSNSTILKITHDKARNYEQQPPFYLERTPDLQFLRCEKPGKQAEQVEAVVTVLEKMGGQVDNQNQLKNEVMVELNCKEATARNTINRALELKKILIVPQGGRGNPSGYKLPK